jgi:hypothetical protein
MHTETRRSVNARPRPRPRLRLRRAATNSHRTPSAKRQSPMDLADSPLCKRGVFVPGRHVGAAARCRFVALPGTQHCHNRHASFDTALHREPHGFLPDPLAERLARHSPRVAPHVAAKRAIGVGQGGWQRREGCVSTRRAGSSRPPLRHGGARGELASTRAIAGLRRQMAPTIRAIVAWRILQRLREPPDRRLRLPQAMREPPYLRDLR